MFKLIAFVACLAAANAGYLGAPAAVGYAAPAYNAYSAGYAAPSVAAISQNTYRSQGNLGQVSTYSKALDTPYSSVRKTDTRVSNDALAYGAAPVAAYGAYAAPAVTSYAAPAVASYAAPAYAKVAAPLAGLGVAYSAAPVVASMTFSGYGINYAY